MLRPADRKQIKVEQRRRDGEFSRSLLELRNQLSNVGQNERNAPPVRISGKCNVLWPEY
jgi:hypothetical protein